MIKGTLPKMGLDPLPHDPWILSGILMQPFSHNNSTQSTSQLHVGLYVDDFVFYFSDPVQEKRFKLFSRIKLRLTLWAKLTTSWEHISTGLMKSTETYHFTYVNQHSNHSQHITSPSIPSKRRQAWPLINLVIPPTQFLLLILSNPLLPTKIKHINTFLDV